MPWKNGRGKTTEVAIHPVDSSLAEGDFVWRISGAEITEPGSFSLFPGFERILAVWSGQSLLLEKNGKIQVVLPMKPTSFSGGRNAPQL